MLVPDLLWFGDSVSGRTPSLDAQADALQALLAARGIRQVELVGISYGGFVAVELARRLPQVVSRLVIVNSPGPVYTPADLQALLQVTRELAANTELLPLLTCVEQAARRVLGCERATVFLYDTATDELVSELATGVEEIRFSADRGIAGEVVRTGQVIHVDGGRHTA